MPRVFLIGGTSHAGKSTVAQSIAKHMGARYLSTDMLGRHPGRPWPVDGRAVRPHVAAHYRELPPQQLLRAVLVHYRNLWPRALAAMEGPAPLVLEGSGVLPECVSSGADAVWLTLDAELLRARMVRESGYDALDGDGRLLVDKFYARALLFDDYVRQSAAARGFTVIAVRAGETPEAVARRCWPG
jgi:2-phosphoglycerate kinase